MSSRRRFGGGTSTPTSISSTWWRYRPAARSADTGTPLTDEEIYIILAGEGEVLIDGRHERIGRGDVAINPPGGEHALCVLGQQPLLMIVVDVSVDGSEYRQPVNIDG